MDTLYSRGHRAWQEVFGTEKLAEFLDAHHVHDALTEDEKAFIAARDMFFLSTVNAQGEPTVSYKGGAPGFVQAVDDKTLAFPCYDGNGMFLSVGNMSGQGKVGLLFIDFETPNRLRAQGTAHVSRKDPLLASFPEAQLVVRVMLTGIWVNCPRYIHTYKKIAQSRYVPSEAEVAPLAVWKRLDMVQEVISEDDRTRANAEGVLDLEAYAKKLGKGEA